MTGPVLQSTYRQYPDVGYPGLLARPEEPTIIERGILGSSTITRAATPSSGLFWDRSGERWRVPQATAEDRTVTGILTYDQSVVQNADDTITFAANDEIKVGLVGCFFGTAGVDLKKGDRLIYNASNGRWNRRSTFSGTDADDLVNGDSEGGVVGSLITCVSNSVSAGGLFMFRISFGIGTGVVYT